MSLKSVTAVLPDVSHGSWCWVRNDGWRDMVSREYGEPKAFCFTCL